MTMMLDLFNVVDYFYPASSTNTSRATTLVERVRCHSCCCCCCCSISISL